MDEVDDAPPLAYLTGPAHPRARRPHAPSRAADDATVASARRGNHAAQAALLRDLQDPWYRMCMGLLGDPERARDAVQETALRFLRQLPGFRGESQLRTWSLGIALNVAREIKRGHARELPSSTMIESAEGLLNAGAMRASGPVPATSPDRMAEAGEQREELRLVLAHLPDRQREAIMLRFFEELSVEETAVAMRCAPGTVKATVHQALRALRQKLKHLA